MDIRCGTSFNPSPGKKYNQFLVENYIQKIFYSPLNFDKRDVSQSLSQSLMLYSTKSNINYLFRRLSLEPFVKLVHDYHEINNFVKSLNPFIVRLL